MASTHTRSARFVTLVSAALVGGAWLAACGSSVDPETTSSATAGTGGSGGAASTCDAPQLLCDGACLDARFDPSNCGACGNANARHFGAIGGPKWSVEHEIIDAANSFNSCETVPATGTLGTFEFDVR